MKQTAVEWFYQRMFAKDIESVFKQALEMEKDQIMDAYKADLYPCLDKAEQYYNETFKSE